MGLDYGSGEVVGGGGGGGGREEEEEEEEGARKVERESDDRPEEEIEIIPSVKYLNLWHTQSKRNLYTSQYLQKS